LIVSLSINQTHKQKERMAQQFKFVEITYQVSSVFMIPADWDEEKICIMDSDKLQYKNKIVSAIAEESDFGNYEMEITADGDNYNADEYDFEEYLYEKPKKELKIEK